MTKEEIDFVPNHWFIYIRKAKVSQIPNILFSSCITSGLISLNASKTVFFHLSPYLILNIQWRGLLLIHYYCLSLAAILSFVSCCWQSRRGECELHKVTVVPMTQHLGNRWWCMTCSYIPFTGDKAPSHITAAPIVYRLCLFFRQWMCQYHTGEWEANMSAIKSNILWHAFNMQRISRIAGIWNPHFF